MQVYGLIAAGFRHRTSRAMDPLLHTHVLVANLARTTDDGIWRTLDGRRLYRHAKTAGTLYQAPAGRADPHPSFAQRDLVRTVAEHLPHGATVDQVEVISRWLLEAGQRDGDVVELDPRAGGAGRGDPPHRRPSVDASGGDGRFTTAELLLLEQTTINAALRRRHDQAGVVDPALVDTVLRRRPTLGDDQTAMVTRLTRDGDAVAVVVGKAWHRQDLCPGRRT